MAIKWKIKKGIVLFYNKKKIVAQETLKDVVGDYVDQREDGWLGNSDNTCGICSAKMSAKDIKNDDCPNCHGLI